MKPQVIYVDTSVIGGYFDPEFREPTKEMWRQMEAGRFKFQVSSITVREMQDAPPRVKSLLEDSFGDRASILSITEEAVILAGWYLAARVVPRRYAADAEHVAVATVNKIAVIVSWNFKHLANVHREAGFNAVNRLQGYPPVRIISPSELIHE